RQINGLLDDARRLISQASLNDYEHARNILNDVSNLIGLQTKRQETRAGIKKEADEKIRATSILLDNCEKILKTAAKYRRKGRIVGPDPLPDLYERLENARKARDRSKTELQQKDYWSIVDAKAFAQKAYELANSVKKDGERYCQKFAGKYASKKWTARDAARFGGDAGAVIGAAVGCIFMYLAL